MKKSSNFAPGEMAEWSIAAVLKTVDCNRSRGSNPCLSASFLKLVFITGFFYFTQLLSKPHLQFIHFLALAIPGR